MVDGASAILLGLHDMCREQIIGRSSARSILRQDVVFSQSHFLYLSQYHFQDGNRNWEEFRGLGEVL